MSPCVPFAIILKPTKETLPISTIHQTSGIVAYPYGQPVRPGQWPYPVLPQVPTPSLPIYQPAQPVNILTVLPEEQRKRHPNDVHRTQIITKKREIPFIQAFVEGIAEMPSLLKRGLTGSSDFTYADKMKLAYIPYVLGGVFLIGGFAAGRNKIEAIRQTAAVVSYFAGVAFAHVGLNNLYNWKYGVDLNLRFRSPTGQEDKVFSSVDFPRFDLLREEDYQRYAKGFDIPDNLNDPYGEIHKRLKAVIVQSRALKVLLGNLFGVLGAAFISRSDLWLRVGERTKTVFAILNEPKIPLKQRVLDVLRSVSTVMADPFISTVKSRSMSKLQKYSLYAALAFTTYSIYKALTLNKQFRRKSQGSTPTIDLQFTKALTEKRDNDHLNERLRNSLYNVQGGQTR